MNKSENTKENLINFPNSFFLLLSFLGILSVCSNILHDERKCDKWKENEKSIKIQDKNSISWILTKIQVKFKIQVKIQDFANKWFLVFLIQLNWIKNSRNNLFCNLLNFYQKLS